MEDYYAALGVNRDAEDIVIRAAYKALAQRYHPDKAPGNEARMQAINTAYTVLSDPIQRQRYDAQYHRGAYQTEARAPQGHQEGVRAAIQIDAAILAGALWFGLRGAIQGGLLFGLIFGALFALLGALGSQIVFASLLGLALLHALSRWRWRGVLPVALLALLAAILADALGSAKEGALLGAIWGGSIGALILGVISALSGIFQAALARAVRQRG